METTKINSWSDLQEEKARLRGRIQDQEMVLKTHYQKLSAQAAPALKIANLISGNKFFSSAINKAEEADKGWLGAALKIVTAVSAGGFLLNHSKKNLMKTLLAYGLDQSVKYIKEHDLTEHVEKLKAWIGVKEENINDVTSESNTNSD
jgi:hypothetical protein